MLSIPFLLIQPIFIFWLFYKLIKLIVNLLKPNNESEFKKENLLLFIAVTGILFPIIGFSLSSNLSNQSADSLGIDDMFNLFAPAHLLEIAIFYFTSIILTGLCLPLHNNQLVISLIRNGLILTLIILSIISSIQLGLIGFLLTVFPFLGLLLIAPVINIFLFSAFLIYHIKHNTTNQISVPTNLLLSLGFAITYIIIFQLTLALSGFDNWGLLKAFTDSGDGFISKLFKI